MSDNVRDTPVEPPNDLECIVALRRTRFRSDRPPVKGARLTIVCEEPTRVWAWTLRLRTLDDLDRLIEEGPDLGAGGPNRGDPPGISFERMDLSSVGQPRFWPVVRLGPGQVDALEPWEVTSLSMPRGARLFVAVARVLGVSRRDLRWCLHQLGRWLRGERVDLRWKPRLDW